MHGSDVALDALAAGRSWKFLSPCQEKGCDEGARQADGLEAITAPVGTEHTDAHFRHDLEQTLIDCGFIIIDRLLDAHVAKQATPLPVIDGFFRQIGIDRGRADADQNGKIVYVQTFRRADVDRRKGPELLTNQMGMHPTGG